MQQYECNGMNGLTIWYRLLSNVYGRWWLFPRVFALFCHQWYQHGSLAKLEGESDLKGASKFVCNISLKKYATFTEDDFVVPCENRARRLREINIQLSVLWHVKFGMETGHKHIYKYYIMSRMNRLATVQNSEFSSIIIIMVVLSSTEPGGLLISHSAAWWLSLWIFPLWPIT